MNWFFSERKCFGMIMDFFLWSNLLHDISHWTPPVHRSQGAVGIRLTRWNERITTATTGREKRRQSILGEKTATEANPRKYSDKSCKYYVQEHSTQRKFAIVAVSLYIFKLIHNFDVESMTRNRYLDESLIHSALLMSAFNDRCRNESNK